MKGPHFLFFYPLVIEKFLGFVIVWLGYARRIMIRYGLGVREPGAADRSRKRTKAFDMNARKRLRFSVGGVLVLPAMLVTRLTEDA